MIIIIFIIIITTYVHAVFIILNYYIIINHKHHIMRRSSSSSFYDERLKGYPIAKISGGIGEVSHEEIFEAIFAFTFQVPTKTVKFSSRDRSIDIIRGNESAKLLLVAILLLSTITKKT
jgi:hypothetical protein